MNIIIPIGGVGQRFKDDNYITPKPLINVLGDPMICRLISGLNTRREDNIHIIYNPELNSYNFEDLLRFKFPKLNLNFWCLDGMTRGASETILFGLDRMDSRLDENFLILDCDTFYEEDILEKYRGCENKNTIFYSKDTQDLPIFSYIRIDEERNVIEIKEKIKISENANTGAYGFSNGRQLKEYCEKISSLNKELYTSLVYEEMLKDGITISSELIEHFSCVGTPLQLKIYCEINVVKEPKRFCFDLDNTLVTYPKISGDYSTVEPLHKNIEYLKFLKKNGNYIIIYTARRMKTHKGNVGAIISDIGKITLDTLSKFEIPYDELFFGKPHADFYIDDLGVNAFHPLDKILGFIDTKNQPRDFNKIDYQTSSVIKTTNNLGEVHWYNNMPEGIKNMFPTIISATGSIIEMEKIKGINYSYLYTHGGLQEGEVDLLLSALKKIHRSSQNREKIDYHQNYGDKMSLRYFDNLDLYNKILGADSLFFEISKRMESYKKAGEVKNGVIHGDPVFTNVFLTETGLKFIDPRGKIGEEFSIFGDVYYDFAKVYQSIIGYDFILNDLDFSFKYQEKIRARFESNFSEEEIRIIKDIAASLLFSLIPLHSFSERKFDRYIKIIKNLLEF
jgi:capsule biosynthesis phosphatase